MRAIDHDIANRKEAAPYGSCPSSYKCPADYLAAFAFSALTFAQRAFCAAMIRVRPTSDIPPFFTGFVTVGADAAFARRDAGDDDQPTRRVLRLERVGVDHTGALL
jgi:hypothetical protein